MYKIIPYSDELDLTEFYSIAAKKGFTNNSSRHMLVDCFSNEREHQTWILYYNDRAIGSVAAHSFDEMGPNSYRIAARTCVFTEFIDGTYGSNLRTLSVITKHQNPTAQFFLPTCIEWAGKENNLYITSNNLEAGSQRRVHKIYFPALARLGQMEFIREMDYRGTQQSIWKLNVDKFYEELNKYPKWN